jgi:ADP-ribosylglycohydrolase
MTWRRNAHWLEVVSIFRLRAQYRLAITAVLEAEAWEDAVRTTVCLGGDTDTLACIAGAVAEVIHGLPRNIADSARAYLTDDLRRGPGTVRGGGACVSSGRIPNDMHSRRLRLASQSHPA